MITETFKVILTPFFWKNKRKDASQFRKSIALKIKGSTRSETIRTWSLRRYRLTFFKKTNYKVVLSCLGVFYEGVRCQYVLPPSIYDQWDILSILVLFILRERTKNEIQLHSSCHFRWVNAANVLQQLDYDDW